MLKCFLMWPRDEIAQSFLTLKHNLSSQIMKICLITEKIKKPETVYAPDF